MTQHSRLPGLIRRYLFATLAAPVFMVLGAIALAVVLAGLLMGSLSNNVVHAMLYINGAIVVFMVGCAFVVYRGTVLTDIAQALQAHGAPGTAQILSAGPNGTVEAERHKCWYELKLAVRPDDPRQPPFTVDTEQLFNADAMPAPQAGDTVPVRFAPQTEIFALVVLDGAYARLK